MKNIKPLACIGLLVVGLALQVSGLVNSAFAYAFIGVGLWVGPDIIARLICRMYDPHDHLSKHDDDTEKNLSVRATVFSTLAAGFGVNSAKNYAHDSHNGSLHKFIVAGIYGTVGFIALMLILVKFTLFVAA